MREGCQAMRLGMVHAGIPQRRGGLPNEQSAAGLLGSTAHDAGMLASLADGYLRHRFAWLFGWLILTITASPALHAISPRVNAVELLLAINLVAVVSTVWREHGMGWMLWIGGAFLALRAGQTASGLRAFVPFTEGLWVIDCSLGMLATARNALRGGRRRPDRPAGEPVLQASGDLTSLPQPRASRRCMGFLDGLAWHMLIPNGSNGADKLVRSKGKEHESEDRALDPCL
jgi:hypothetical protein